MFIPQNPVKEELFSKKTLREKVDKLIDIVVEKINCLPDKEKPISAKEEKNSKQEIDISKLFISLSEAMIECFEQISQELNINLSLKMKPIENIIHSLSPKTKD